MSTQNSLKKPVFTKSMLGYTPKEVDQYIEYMNDRYSALCRDASELRRRVTRLQLGLESAKEEAETNIPAAAETGFSDGAIDRLRGMIEAERKRHEEALDALVSFIESHSHGESIPEKAPSADFGMSGDEGDEKDGFVILADDEPEVDVVLSDEDTDWQEALEEFISDAGEAEDTEAEEAEMEIAESEDTEESVTQAVPEKKKTPAEIAAELDFYSDNVVRDGESYDPMTLAQSSTMKRRRPTLEDFVNPISDDRNTKK